MQFFTSVACPGASWLLLPSLGYGAWRFSRHLSLTLFLCWLLLQHTLYSSSDDVTNVLSRRMFSTLSHFSGPHVEQLDLTDMQPEWWASVRLFDRPLPSSSSSSSPPSSSSLLLIPTSHPTSSCILVLPLFVPLVLPQSLLDHSQPHYSTDSRATI
jgi:hypothetical protein